MTDAKRCFDLGCTDLAHVAMGSHEARPMAEPQTTAGRQMHDDRHVSQDCPALTWDGKPTGEKCQWLDDILAIEHEAARGSAEALRGLAGWGDEHPASPNDDIAPSSSGVGGTDG